MRIDVLKAMSIHLPRRPQATHLSVEDLLERVQRGAIRVPEFQSGLRWKKKDHRLLFDSLYRGFPAGALLFWQRSAPSARVNIGPLEIDAQARPDAWWVVDGQQRITTLVGALLQPEPSDFSMYFDLEAGDFKASRRSGRASWLPLHRLADSTQLLEWIAAYPQRETHPDHIKLALQVSKAIREYQFPAYVMDVEEVETAREVFTRLNTGGHALKRADVFDALNASVAVGAPASLSAIQRDLRDLGFGPIDRGVVEKTVLGLLGLDVTSRPEKALARAHLDTAWPRATAGLRAAVLFVKSDAGIVRSELLPYSLPLAVLGKFFGIHPNPKPRSRELLSRWLWRGAVSGFHRGESIPQVRQQFVDVGAEEEASVQRLLKWTPPERIREWVLESFNLKTARSRIEANYLVSLKPVRRAGPTELRPIDVGDAIEQGGGAAFAPMFGTMKKDPHDARYTRALLRLPLVTIANRVLRWSRGKPLSELLDILGDPAAAVTHAFDEQDQLRLLALEGEEGPSGVLRVLHARGERIRTGMVAFLNSRTGSSQSDRPSLAALTVPDEVAP